MQISNHIELILFLIISFGYYPVVLGIKWLQKHNMQTKRSTNIVSLNSPYSKKNYLKLKRTTIVPGIIEVPNTPKYFQTVDDASLACSKIKKPKGNLLKKPRTKTLS